MPDWVLVHWLDITSCEHPWMTKEEVADVQPTEMWSVGTVISNSDKALVIAGTYDPQNESYGNVNALPKGIVLSIRPLRIACGSEAPVRDAGIGG